MLFQDQEIGQYNNKRSALFFLFLIRIFKLLKHIYKKLSYNCN